MTITKTYRTDRSPSRLAKKAAQEFMMANEPAAKGTCAKVLSFTQPNKFSANDRPNKLAHQTAREIVGKFSQWLMDSSGYLVTHCEGRKLPVGHSFWLTFKGFCKFSQAARQDSQGKARRSTTAQKKLLSAITEEQHAKLDKITFRLARGLITDRMAESLRMDLLDIATGPDAETVSKNSRRYRSRPRQHAAVDGIDPVSDELSPSALIASDIDNAEWFAA